MGNGDGFGEIDGGRVTGLAGASWDYLGLLGQLSGLGQQDKPGKRKGYASFLCPPLTFIFTPCALYGALLFSNLQYNFTHINGVLAILVYRHWLTI